MGARLFGRYELREKLALGGMAEVYLALHRGRAGFVRRVIIKRLFSHLADHARVLTLFKNEARLLATLEHPAIPQVYDFGFVENRWYMAMEHVHGYSVAQLFEHATRSAQALPTGVAISIIMQAADALHHAHESRDARGQLRGIVHRDVTPHNLMLTHLGHLKVLDFGVAQTSEGSGTLSGAVTGTYAYMPPEQIQGRKLDRRADVFALAVILYELTTGKRLFEGSDLEIMTAVVEEQPQSPGQVVPDYPPELEQIVMMGLERERMKRFASAEALLDALQRFATQHELMTGPRPIRDYLRSYASTLPQSHLAPVDEAASDGGLLEDTLPESEDFGDFQGSFDDDSLLEDIQLLSEPLGQKTEASPTVERRRSDTVEFPADALSADLGEDDR